MVTLVDLTTLSILTRISAQKPTVVTATGYVASALDDTITTYDTETLEVLSVIRNVPNPQDFVGTDAFLGVVAVIGGADSIALISSDSSDVTIVPEIPGAAGVASSRWSSFRSPSKAVVFITSRDSDSLFFLQRVPPEPSEFTMINAASFSPMVAPGSLASVILGSQSTGVDRNLTADFLPLPTTLGGMTLRLGGELAYNGSAWEYSGGIPVPLLFVGPQQINFQVPSGINPPGAAVPAQLERPDGTALLTRLSLQATAPGIFTVLAAGRGLASVLNQDNSLNGNPETILGVQPAARGSVIQIFATGAGATDLSLLPGEPAPAGGNPLVRTQVQPTVRIGGSQAHVLFSEMAPGLVGVWQINALVPENITPDVAVPMSITAGGVTSNTVRIAVE